MFAFTTALAVALALFTPRSANERHYIGFQGKTIGKSEIQAISRNGRIPLAEFRNCTFTSDIRETLDTLLPFTRIQFVQCTITQPMIKLLGVSSLQSSVEWIEFTDCDITDDDLVQLAESGLTRLVMDERQVSERAVLELRKENPSLYISIRNNRFPPLNDMARVEQLTFSESLISDATIESIQHAGKVNSISLYGCSISVNGFRHLQSLPSLQSLTVSEIQIPKEGFHELGKLTHLIELNLNSEHSNMVLSIPDEAVDDLAKISSLRRLTLGRTIISENAISRLRQALPLCEIKVN